MNDFGNVYVAGHRGMVGSAIVRALQRAGVSRILARTHAELDLTDQSQTEAFFRAEKPDTVFMAEAHVGGIGANSAHPAEFCEENLAVALNTIRAARKAGVKRFLFLGSTCIYPREAPQPIPESALLSGPLEPTNEGYALAKIAGVKLCDFYRAQYGLCYHGAMPTNLYGPGDNYHIENAHVLPALLRRFHEAKQNNAPRITIWGTGTPLREFLHADDLADALLLLASLPNPPSLVNVGSGEEVSILQLARLIAETVGYQGEIVCDPSRPDGTPRKLCDTTRLRALGWQPKISLKEGLKRTYADFLQETQIGHLRAR